MILCKAFIVVFEFELKSNFTMVVVRSFSSSVMLEESFLIELVTGNLESLFEVSERVKISFKIFVGVMAWIDESVGIVSLKKLDFFEALCSDSVSSVYLWFNEFWLLHSIFFFFF